MQFIDPFGNPSKIVVGTGYHQVRVYDMRLTSVIHQGSGATIYSVEDENQEDSVNNNDNADIPIITKSQRKKMARAKHDQMNLNRPLFSVEIGEHPIKCISVCPNNPS